MKKILVVDDEQSILTLLKYNLEQNGFQVYTADNGVDALDIARSLKPQAIVLDLMLPKKDGIEVAKELRQDKINIPILMLTAKDDELDKIIGLEIGADDYMTKPFSPREVVARIKAILRRVDLESISNKESADIITVGDLEIHTLTYSVYLRGKKLDLTPREYELLMYLTDHIGHVLSRHQLLNGVWNFDFDGDTRIVDVHISKLREKIEQDSRRPKYIQTVRGFGYKLEVPGK
ncbi:response regulator transcription factor [Phocicoccus pinnipedialis]|uniref:Alkaline phosphatase synthesis transcriptional regulatory protein PhoP n=2 Tax=Phocicoccus pinnipedialis TaxID=110845 RepID=A0A6V7R0I9_9BACL|nr:response regulator transcription factor [Jeotgalicoccus pinnipedialis]MBP1938739.1 two-component system alkaline phosphatase synthesis response regulator PhoP [Jeotgalicoccus pinnipedialis]CAD2070584.1 Alkaline phosphatase synthesis transcriptional regulatory protein PhoP [Jeotgalicoccus pinnipedialis]